MNHPEDCEYRRTGIAVALWAARKDTGRVVELIDGTDNPRHVLEDQATTAMMLVKALTGNTEAVFTTSNLPEIAAQRTAGTPDDVAREIAAAHLAGAVLAQPALAAHLCDDLARWTAPPVAFFTCATAVRMTGGKPEGLLEQMARAGGAGDLVDIVMRAAAGD